VIFVENLYFFHTQSVFDAPVSKVLVEILS